VKCEIGKCGNVRMWKCEKCGAFAMTYNRPMGLNYNSRRHRWRIESPPNGKAQPTETNAR